MAEGNNMGIVKAMVLFVWAMLVPKAPVVAENVALRQQLAVVSQSVRYRRAYRPA